jgi:two-component system, NarL family, sensor histidine kinase UhpB
MCTEGSPCRLLLIEDDALLLKLIEAKNQQGHFIEYSLDLTIAKTLSEAVNILETAARPFDVISLDLRLPDSDGMRTFDAIHDLAPNVPIFIYSGNAEKSFIEIIMAHGAERFIFKGEWSVDQYLTLLHYGAGQGRARARRREESEQRKRDAEFYKEKWQDAASQLSAIRKKIPESKASKELDQIISKMKLAVAS